MEADEEVVVLLGGVSWVCCCWWAVKFWRREEVSSVLDFSKVGRRIMEGLPDIMLLGVLLV